jgi:hypothetical protein
MMNRRGLSKGALSVALLAFVFGLSLPAWADDAKRSDKDEKKDKKPGPAKKMKILEVFPSKSFTVVSIKFYDAKGKETSVEEGTFAWWSNFLKDRRKPAKKRKIDLAKVHYRKGKYTLKLAGFKRLCPPRTAKIRVTFHGKKPKRRFRRTWKKRASCK